VRGPAPKLRQLLVTVFTSAFTMATRYLRRVEEFLRNSRSLILEAFKGLKQAYFEGTEERARGPKVFTQGLSNRGLGQSFSLPISRTSPRRLHFRYNHLQSS
jgi:hypothetical protein